MDPVGRRERRIDAGKSGEQNGHITFRRIDPGLKISHRLDCTLGQPKVHLGFANNRCRMKLDGRREIFIAQRRQCRQWLEGDNA
ncbi:MAG: hypothetical protein CVU31_19355 [Betaproteobacteria bacterium HGW-Betaproteobacteria-4]|nr:MAG: hypothetical protein CVU31_19355 [Betaproteobacteria bacterium HGW-Betaproteobacteria-4]